MKSTFWFRIWSIGQYLGGESWIKIINFVFGCLLSILFTNNLESMYNDYNSEPSSSSSVPLSPSGSKHTPDPDFNCSSSSSSNLGSNNQVDKIPIVIIVLLLVCGLTIAVLNVNGFEWNIFGDSMTLKQGPYDLSYLEGEVKRKSIELAAWENNKLN